jgi:hypothetical protein
MRNDAMSDTTPKNKGPLSNNKGPQRAGQLSDIDKDERPGDDLKKARGLGKNAGQSANEAGTDQRVEDAKKSRHANQ